jgi:signal transduction histidine kinase
MPQQENLIFILIVLFTTCLFVMGVFFFILVNKYRKSLERRQKEALNNLIVGQDNERERIARDLHDEMGPELSNLIFSLDGIKSEAPAVIEMVEKSKMELRDAIKRLRNISHDLMSQSLIKYGLYDAIKEMVERKAHSAIRIDYQSNCADIEFRDSIKSNIFRITQELLYNTYKHSGATEVDIKLEHQADKQQLLFTYSDNGIGNKENKTTGIGIKNIYTRVGLMNGTFHVDMNNGFKSIIVVDLQ